MTEFQPGEVIDITIRSARIASVQRHDDAYISFDYGALDQPCRSGVRLDAPSVTVERVAPAEWPPQAGDLWRDKHGELWFIHADPTDRHPKPLVGRTPDGMRWTDDAARLIEDNAPLTLVHREPGTGGSVVMPKTTLIRGHRGVPAEVQQAAATIRGYRDEVKGEDL